MADTIYALSSAPGKAGVAVIRVSGSVAHNSLNSLILNGKLPSPRQGAVRKLVDPVSGETLDEAFIIRFDGPSSFTGEDVIEYHCHGSPAVVEGVLAALSTQEGHRLAEPGEFTRRAFENGKLDLTAAEAVADLIDSETTAQRQQALDQMGGALARLYDGWREELIRSLAYIEAVIDFPDEDVPDSETAKARPAIEKLLGEISAHLDDNRRGERLRDGVQVAVIGAPNAGKSSLVNALAKRDVAIVSPMAGTTRDIVEVHLNIAGYPVILADTAGLRPDQLTEDNAHQSIESEGIRRALKRAEEADIRLLVFDGTAEPDQHTAELIDQRVLILINKTDCHPEGAQRLKDLLIRSFATAQDDIILLSVSTGEGVDTLLDKLREKLVSQLCVSRETPSLTRTRHRAALVEAKSHLASALAADLPELMAEDLRLAARGLGRLTGRVDVEDLLDVIFRDFCIGK